MKKTLLTVLAFAMLSTTAFAQNFISAPDGFSYNCEYDTTNSTPKNFTWAVYTPQNNGGGGQNDAPVGELRVQWGQGSKGQMYLIFTLGNTVDLSANPNVSVMLRSAYYDLNTSTEKPVDMTYRVSLEADGGVHLTDSILANVTGTKQAFSFDFTGKHIKPNVDLKKVKKIIFIYDSFLDNVVYGDPTNNPARLYFSEFKAGSLATVGVEDELLSRISESVVYPNPTSSQVNVKLHLNTTSNVKVVLKDAQGNAVRTLTEQSTNAIDQAFNVSDLASGLYFISYQIDGAAVKTQKLLVN